MKLPALFYLSATYTKTGVFLPGYLWPKERRGLCTSKQRSRRDWVSLACWLVGAGQKGGAASSALMPSQSQFRESRACRARFPPLVFPDLQSNRLSLC